MTTSTEHKIKWHFKHKRSKKRVKKILKKIESYKGITNPKLIKQSDEYAQEILGDKQHAPWLYVYSALQNRFVEGWIPDDYYKKEVIPRLNGEYGEVANRNFVLPFLFTQVETLDLGYIINGKFCTIQNKIIHLQDLKTHLFQNNNKIVYKLENSKRGKGVIILDENSFDSSLFPSNRYKNGVFKKFIHQHPFFLDFTKNSVATIRVTTASDENGHISAKAAYIRFGRDNDSHVISSSAVSVPIDINTGELYSKGYMSWVEIDKHPDTNTSFQHKIIPNFDACKEKAIQMHSVVPFMGCIGWDFAVDHKEDVQLIELNGINNGIKFSEATTGPSFKDLNWEKLWKEV